MACPLIRNITQTETSVAIFVCIQVSIEKRLAFKFSEMNDNYYIGEQVSMGRGSARVYLEKPDPYELRSMKQHKEDLKIAMATRKPCRGVCGPTSLSFFIRRTRVRLHQGFCA